VLNVLLRLEYGDWLQRHPEWRGHGLARRVLARLLDALAVPPEDPIRALTAATHAADRQEDPPRRRRAVVRAWSLAVHGWLRRRAGIGVADLVLRPGRLALTRTHVDLWLDPELCDLRIRRAGLDLDPGWLPWMGRVVAFHYGPGAPR
jgi:hypothetical protein